MKTSKLLISEPPLQIIPTLAVLVGLNGSIVLQQLHYWLNNKNSGVEKNGYKWIFNTYKEWQESFPFWSERTIQRIFKTLEETGIIVSEQLDRGNYDMTKYYRIDYDKLSSLTMTDCQHQYRQDVSNDDAKLASSTILTETSSTESSAESSAENPQPDFETDPIQRMFEVELGIMPSISDFKILDDFKSMGATIEDLREGVKWRLEHNSSPITNYKSVIEPTRIAMLKRTQQKFASGRTRKVTNQDGEVVEIPA